MEYNGQRSGSGSDEFEDKDPLATTDPLNEGMLGTQTDNSCDADNSRDAGNNSRDAGNNSRESGNNSRESGGSGESSWVAYDNESFPSLSERGLPHSPLSDTVSGTLSDRDSDLSDWDVEVDDALEPPAKRAKVDNDTR